MGNQSIYRELAKYYDPIYSWKDYRGEVRILSKLLEKHRRSDGNDLLEVGCGTGHHLTYLKQRFSCLGTDINRGILDVARKNVKGVTFRNADMVSLDLNRRFDVILCLFSSIGYVKTLRNLKRTMDNFARHLKSGGVVIIEPWFTKSVFKAGRPSLHTYSDDHLKIARMSFSEVRGNVSIVHMEYLVGEKGRRIRHFRDRHELGLFGTETTLRFMRQAGLKAKFLKNGLMKDRGLFIGIKE